MISGMLFNKSYEQEQNRANRSVPKNSFRGNRGTQRN